MSFFLALDAGGTKTDYVLADETRELARARSGSLKRMRVDAATASRHLDDGLSQLSATSGVAMRAVSRTCIGTAGETVPLVADWLREAVAARVGGTLEIVGDVVIALDAAFPGQPGVLVLAGTGSNVAGRTPAGVVTTAGGYGPAVSDQGSGYRIGFEALGALFLARDEGRETALERAVLDYWSMDTLEQLVDFANRLPAPDFSRLTETVVACAAQGDEIATSVLQHQGEELGYLTRIVMRRLRAQSEDRDWVPPVAFAGSIMERVLPVRQALIDNVREEFPGVQTLDGVVDPVCGALWRARAGVAHR